MLASFDSFFLFCYVAGLIFCIALGTPLTTTSPENDRGSGLEHKAEWISHWPWGPTMMPSVTQLICTSLALSTSLTQGKRNSLPVCGGRRLQLRAKPKKHCHKKQGERTYRQYTLTCRLQRFTKLNMAISWNGCISLQQPPAFGRSEMGASYSICCVVIFSLTFTVQETGALLGHRLFSPVLWMWRCEQDMRKLA